MNLNLLKLTIFLATYVNNLKGKLIIKLLWVIIL